MNLYNSIWTWKSLFRIFLKYIYIYYNNWSIILSGYIIELYELSVNEDDDVLIHLIMRCVM